MRYLILFLIPFLIAAAPSRQYSYSSGDTIDANKVTANEDVVFSYLQSGVEVYSDGSITNADLNTSANIQCSKLNLAACSQNVVTSADVISSSDIYATAIIAGISIQVPYSYTLPSTCSTGELYIDLDADTNGSLYICASGSWKEVDDD